MMHNDQLKVFFVGGPNQRKDFHLEEGEELFYKRKGDMSLPILTQGSIRTVHIKEGGVLSYATPLFSNNDGTDFHAKKQSST